MMGFCLGAVHKLRQHLKWKGCVWEVINLRVAYFSLVFILVSQQKIPFLIFSRETN